MKRRWLFTTSPGMSMRYVDRLNNFIVQSGHFIGKWEIFSMIKEEVNGQTRTLLEYFDFLQNVNEDV